MFISDDPIALSHIQALFRNRRGNDDLVFAIFKRFQHVLLLHLCLSCSEQHLLAADTITTQFTHLYVHYIDQA